MYYPRQLKTRLLNLLAPNKDLNIFVKSRAFSKQCCSKKIMTNSLRLPESSKKYIIEEKI
jgi:hypothetical protein